MNVGKRLEKKVALVTGAGTGLGEATAALFAKEGAHVYVSDIDADSVESTARDIRSTGLKATARQQDVTDETGWEHLLAEIMDVEGQLDVIVNNAGIALGGNAETTTLDDWRRTQSVNLDGVFLGTRAAIGAMKSRGGAIINMSSIEGIVGEPEGAAYNASKGGVRVFTKSAALHCGKMGYGIRVNSVHPGFILTDMVKNILADMSDGMRQKMLQRFRRTIPLGGKLGEPQDIANACLFLASDESKYVTGAELVVDGGFTAQ